MHQDYDHMEEISLLDLYQEEIDHLTHQNKKLSESEDPVDQRQLWKNQIVIEYFQKRIDYELVALQQHKNSSPKTIH